MPDSILGIYAELENAKDCYTLLTNNVTKNRRPCTIMPDQNLLSSAVTLWGKRNPSKASEGLAHLYGNKKVLLVHLRSGDKGGIGFPKGVYESIQEVSQDFQKIVMITGVHADVRFKPQNESITNLHTDLKELSAKLSFPNLEFYPHKDADVHIYMMQKAKHLFLHKGGFSAIGGLVNEGTVYFTRLFDVAYNVSLFENLMQKEEVIFDNPKPYTKLQPK